MVGTLSALESAILEMAWETTPAVQILFLALSGAQELPESIGADADRHQHR